ncbi:hypothetical protein FHR55_001253 [Xanthomonas arboricola]
MRRWRAWKSAARTVTVALLDVPTVAAAVLLAQAWLAVPAGLGVGLALLKRMTVSPADAPSPNSVNGGALAGTQTSSV